MLLVQIPPDLLLVETLKTVFAYAPLKAGMKATPRFADLKALIEDNPDLKDALRDAISRGRYEDVMSLCGYLWHFRSFPLMITCISHPSKRRATGHYDSSPVSG